MNKTITVFIVAYNQEEVISKTLDSILCQKDWGLHQVIVGDDCSSDGTWSLLEEYHRRYPSIVLPFRNDHNLGIYANMEKVISLRGTSDLYCSTAGDDPYCDGYFESIQRFIEDNNVDTREAIGIYSDWKSVDLTGKEKVYRQDLAISGHDLLSLFTRLKILTRSIMVSRSVVDCYRPIILDQGINLAEWMYEAQPHRFIQKAYYMPKVTTTYYILQGISTRLSVGKSDYYTRQATIKWKYWLDHYVSNEKDEAYVKYELEKASFFECPKWGKYFRMMYYYFKGLLPHCHNSLKEILILFLQLARYKIAGHQ